MHRRTTRWTRILTSALLSCAIIGPAAMAGNWPSFRGPNGSGLAPDAQPPVQFSALSGDNIRWKTPIPGLGHSSPVIWGDRIFITTAVSDKDPYLRVGLYGESPDNPEPYEHDYRVICLDRGDGTVVWSKTVVRGVPKIQRHIKSSHANPTVATDGKHVVAFFGSEGLVCLNMDGNVLWRKDLGLLDSGAFDMPSIRWGFGSSPIIFEDRVIVLCDVNNQSFIAAFDIDQGNELWRTLRDEVPTWGTPTIYAAANQTQVIVNGYQHLGSYDAQTGEPIWWMKGGGDIPVPRPVVAHDMAFFTNAHGRLSPIYAVRLSAKGDISLKPGETSNEFVAWSDPRRGAYMPTPIVIDDLLYLGSDRGILTCYRAKTGEQVYRQRLGSRGDAFTASPVAAGDHIYFTSEDGQIHVVQTGTTYRHLATNPMGEVCLATPAIADDMIIIRTRNHLFGIGQTQTPLTMEATPQATASSEEMASKTPEPAEAATTGEVDPKDPKAILTRVDAMARSVQSVSYDISVEGTGAMKERLGHMQASVVAAGLLSGLPRQFRVKGSAQLPGAPAPTDLCGGCDGNRFYAVDFAGKTVHADFEPSVMGTAAQAIFSAIVREFYLDNPFGDEINAEAHEIRGEMNIGGEACWVIHVTYKTQPPAEATWYLAKSDFLPRGRLDEFTLPTGEKGGIFKQIKNLKVNSEFKLEAFELAVPEGFSVVDTPMQ